MGSATSQADEYKLAYGEREEQDLGIEVQKEFTQINNDHAVKSAVGSERVKQHQKAARNIVMSHRAPNTPVT